MMGVVWVEGTAQDPALGPRVHARPSQPALLDADLSEPLTCIHAIAGPRRVPTSTTGPGHSRPSPHLFSRSSTASDLWERDAGSDHQAHGDATPGPALITRQRPHPGKYGHLSQAVVHH